jgi:hypothetical protein
VWPHTWRKNWVNCAVLTRNITGLRTVLSSRLSNRELRSSLRESHNFLSLPADTKMASSQGTQPSKMNKRDVTLTFIGAYRSLPELWDAENRHYSNIIKKAAAYDSVIKKWKVWLANAKTALFLSTIVARTRRHTEMTKKKKKKANLMGNQCCAREHSVQYFVQYLQLNCAV